MRTVFDLGWMPLISVASVWDYSRGSIDLFWVVMIHVMMIMIFVRWASVQ